MPFFTTSRGQASAATAPDRVREVFETVRDARDRAVEAVADAVKSKRDIRGFEVDDAARNHIRARGFGGPISSTAPATRSELKSTEPARTWTISKHTMNAAFCPGALFSIEPGIYLEDFGVRSEVNVFVTANSASTTGAVQRELVRIG